jgi:predicted nucleic acid-binding Zn ribbon protein
VQGIEPLRREKRIARNRFLMMFVLFLLILCGVFAVMRP